MLATITIAALLLSITASVKGIATCNRFKKAFGLRNVFMYRYDSPERMDNNNTMRQATNFLFWNGSSFALINPVILEAPHPLKINFGSNAEVVDVHRLRPSRKAMLPELELEQAKDQVIIHYDYLGPSEGFVIRVLHTGNKHTRAVLENTPEGNTPVHVPFIKCGYLGLVYAVIIISAAVSVACAVYAGYNAEWLGLQLLYCAVAMLSAGFLTYGVHKYLDFRKGRPSKLFSSMLKLMAVVAVVFA